MKMIFQIVFGILCINSAILVLQSYSILSDVTYLTPMNMTQITDAVDPNGTATSGSISSTITVFTYVKEAIYGFLRIGSTIFVGFPLLLADLGTPAPIVTAVVGLTTVLWGLFFLELFAGRDVVD